ncbi:MAG: hypothetical protein ACYS32_02740 [Planctomycetota bacterium]
MRKVSDIAIKPSARRQIGRNFAGNEDFLQIALIELPPYGRAPIGQNTTCTLGQLADTKEWFVTTPAAALISEGKVGSSCEGEAPESCGIWKAGKKLQKEMFRSYQQILHMTRYIIRKEVGAMMLEVLDDW